MFTYILIVIVISAVIYSKYFNNRLGKAIEEAVTLGEAEKVLIEDYYDTHGKMPQSGAEAGLDRFTPSGVLTGLTWVTGAAGEHDSNILSTGTLKGTVDLVEFGERFKEYGFAYVLIAKVQDDGILSWQCMADPEATDALPGRYLPESCKNENDDE